MVFTLIACTSPADISEEIENVSKDLVTVERRSLTSTVVLSGTVIPRPEYLVESPEAGAVVFSEALSPNLEVGTNFILGRVAGQDISISAPGVVTSLIIDSGTTVSARIPIAQIAYQGFGVLLEVPITAQYRMYQGALSARVNIIDGPSGLTCELVTPAISYGATNNVLVLCLLPLDAQVISGLQVKAGLVTGIRENVLSLPLSAVSGRIDQGEVTRILPDGNLETVVVKLGLTDGIYIEIIEGINQYDQVLSNAPGIR